MPESPRNHRFIASAGRTGKMFLKKSKYFSTMTCLEDDHRGLLTRVHARHGGHASTAGYDRTKPPKRQRFNRPHQRKALTQALPNSFETSSQPRKLIIAPPRTPLSPLQEPAAIPPGLTNPRYAPPLMTLMGSMGQFSHWRVGRQERSCDDEA